MEARSFKGERYRELPSIHSFQSRAGSRLRRPPGRRRLRSRWCQARRAVDRAKRHHQPDIGHRCGWRPGTSSRGGRRREPNRVGDGDVDFIGHDRCARRAKRRFRNGHRPPGRYGDDYRHIHCRLWIARGCHGRGREPFARSGCNQRNSVVDHGLSDDASGGRRPRRRRSHAHRRAGHMGVERPARRDGIEQWAHHRHDRRDGKHHRDVRQSDVERARACRETDAKATPLSGSAFSWASS
jgi:hypothetical protein